MKSVLFATLLLSCVLLVSAKTYFKEEFSDGAAWENRWVKSHNKESEGSQGKWGLTAGKFYGDEKINTGLQTTQDARFYQISAEFPEFSNRGKPLVFQFSVKHEQNIDCGGGYAKILPAGVDQKDFKGDDKYYIMFGPDICGHSTNKVHLIFHYNGKNLDMKKSVTAKKDEFTHLYTMILNPDKTYKILIDNEEVGAGNLLEDWDFLAPKQIKDPKAKKPADWVDEKKIADPTDAKPADWDNEPEKIVDKEAKKPEDWDDEVDGEWEAPMIDNPAYKGEWKPRMIDNPAYKGEWVHPLIDNPEYKEDPEIGVYDKAKYVGIEIWQVKSGTIFDNFIVTDDPAEARALSKATFEKTKDAEKAAKEKLDEEKKKAEEAQRADEEDEEDEEEDDSHSGHDEL